MKEFSSHLIVYSVITWSLVAAKETGKYSSLGRQQAAQLKVRVILPRWETRYCISTENTEMPIFLGFNST